MGLKALARADLDGPPPLTGEELASMGLAAFAASNRRAVIRSAVLGEDVLFAGEAARVNGGDLVVYRGRELELLTRLSPEALRRAHLVKKIFGGRVTEVVGG